MNSNTDINKKILITDTSVLINFLNINRLDLLIAYPGKFLITEHVIEEITIDFPEQQSFSEVLGK
jgi:predicted nucleic acid-binding protein